MKKIHIDFSKKRIQIELAILVVLILGSLVSGFVGWKELRSSVGKVEYIGEVEMKRNVEEEDFSEDNEVCEVPYYLDEEKMVVSYSYEDYEKLDSESIVAQEYKSQDGSRLFFQEKDPSAALAQKVYTEQMAEKTMSTFNLCSSLAILALSLGIMIVFDSMFTTYEKTWFLSIMVLATVLAVWFPEESANGVNGIIIMLLYLLDTFLNILCELLISKQNKYNFLVSIAVEITEIVISLVLMYRFATLAVTLLFWLPIDILSYFNWMKHEDEVEEELTKVRRLKGWQEVLVIVAIVVWTIVVGYLISGLDIATDFYHNRTLATIIVYLDACASAVGIANGLFIFFRFREQWLAWYLCAFLETVINILSGQYVLLVLKLGYFTNTTYGYIKWTKYIQSHKEEKLTVF